MRCLFPLCAVALALSQIAASVLAVERPNIVWIVTEDNSPDWLRLYNPAGGAPMPHIERLAARGLVFNHAFSNAPVCSVARSTLISGCYAPRVLAQFHRRTELAPLPGTLKMFPHDLRAAGYYTTNNSKEDYNFVKTTTAWDESSNKASYRHRAENQPFFHVQNYTTTHESRLHFSAKQMQTEPTQTDPASVSLFPYHPDTPTFRYTYARQLDQHRLVDAEIGRFLDQLEADGVLDDTIVFYYGDHGGVLPRGKGYVYESGLHVPLIVAFPERWKHLAPATKGTRIDGFVSFVDLAPTVLHLAGVEVPAEMDGRPLLGEGITLDELNSRRTAFGYADRFDEKYDLVRTWRKGRFKYLRSYQPFNVDSLHNQYRYRMLAYQEWRRLFQEGQLTASQRQFFERRPAESLYDLESDPHEVRNLADDPQYAGLLVELRSELQQQVKSLPDLSFFPEPVLLEKALANPVEFGAANREQIAALVDIADLSLQPFDAARDALTAALHSDSPWERYWGLIACSAFAEEAEPFAAQAQQLAAEDAEPLVRVRAAEFLGLIGAADPRPFLLAALRLAKSPTEANLMLNTAALLEDGSTGSDFSIDADLFPRDWLGNPQRPSNLALRIEYLNQSR